jgi:hypothetical protein
LEFLAAESTPQGKSAVDQEHGRNAIGLVRVVVDRRTLAEEMGKRAMWKLEAGSPEP